MTDKKCNGNCCDGFFENYNDIEDDYDIERLEDIIEICQFLIKTKKHRIQKRETMKKLFEEDEEKKMIISILLIQELNLIIYIDINIHHI